MQKPIFNSVKNPKRSLKLFDTKRKTYKTFTRRNLRMAKIVPDFKKYFKKYFEKCANNRFTVVKNMLHKKLLLVLKVIQARYFSCTAEHKLYNCLTFIRKLLDKSKVATKIFFVYIRRLTLYNSLLL